MTRDWMELCKCSIFAFKKVGKDTTCCVVIIIGCFLYLNFQNKNKINVALICGEISFWNFCTKTIPKCVWNSCLWCVLYNCYNQINNWTWTCVQTRAYAQDNLRRFYVPDHDADSQSRHLTCKRSPGLYNCTTNHTCCTTNTMTAEFCNFISTFFAIPTSRIYRHFSVFQTRD